MRAIDVACSAEWNVEKRSKWENYSEERVGQLAIAPELFGKVGKPR